MEVKIIQDTIIYKNHQIDEHYELIGNTVARVYKITDENGKILKESLINKQAAITYINVILMESKK